MFSEECVRRSHQPGVAIIDVGGAFGFRGWRSLGPRISSDLCCRSVVGVGADANARHLELDRRRHRARPDSAAVDEYVTLVVGGLYVPG